MSSIEKIDKNFAVCANIDKDDVVLYNALSEPFRIYGIYHDGVKYRRIPDDVAANTNDGVLSLCCNTAGGRVRFITDSPYVAIKVKLGNRTNTVKMAAAGAAGFDMYVKHDGIERYVNTFLPPVDLTNEFESVVDQRYDGEQLVTINFPLYNDVHELYIGLKDGSSLKSAPDYTISKPFVYYGSSVTQGGCASRPGTCYQGYISRHFDADYINLGFSGSARGEAAIRDYVADLDMSIFILDYDHNSPTYETLVETHEPFYRAVRAKHPNVPIILTSKPDAYLYADHQRRKDFIESSYNRWRSEGDENVYFISGPELMKLAGEEGTVDRIHPTDLGFYSMAMRFIEQIEKILEKN